MSKTKSSKEHMDYDHKSTLDKPPMQLIDPVAMKSLGETLRYGLNKYGVEHGPTYELGQPDTYLGALYRHLLAWQDGEITDPESGMPHLDHAFFNAYILLLHEKQGKRLKRHRNKKL